MQRFTDGSDGFIEVEDGRIVNIGVKYAGGNDQARTNHHAAIARGVMWIQAAAALQAQQEASEVEQAPTRRRGTVTNGIATFDAAVEQAQQDAYQDNEARRIGLI